MNKKKDKKDTKTLRKANPVSEWSLGIMLGKGSFGEVYLTKNSLGEAFAAKICEIKCEGDYTDMKLEVEILTMCDHPNILKARASYFFEKKIWMILDYCQGGALDDVIEKLDGLDELTIRAVMYQSINGLDYLHKKGIIHRDIKAGNIMLTEQGILKIADFGVSAVMPSPHDYRNTFIGTPYWMAPEAILTESFPNQKYSVKVDIWSMGITIIECAEVIPPDCDYSPVQVLLVRTKSPPPSLKEPEKWSSEMNNFIEQTLIKDPNRRPNAEKCLSHPWLSGDEIKSPDKLIELFKISKALDQDAEVEVLVDESQTNQIDVELDEGIDNESLGTSSTGKSKESMAISPDNKSSYKKEDKTSTKTIRKTVRVEVNGITKTRTIVKIVNEDNKGMREKDKSVREKIMNQMKALKLEEQRELKKLVQNQKSYLQDLTFKQKAEIDNMMEKYRSECDSTLKGIQRDMEKKKSAMKNEIEKYLKKVKSHNDKEKKNHLKAIKSKSKISYDVMYQDSDFIPKLQKSSFEQFLKYALSLKEEYANTYENLIKQRNEHLTAILANIGISKLSHALELAQVQRAHICAILELVLQQKFKSDSKEQNITSKHMNDKIEEIKQKHSRVLRDMPKLQRANLKKAMENLKKSLRQQKIKNEKEILQRRQEEMIEQLENEKKTLKETQDIELKKLNERNDNQIKDIKEYQLEKSKMTHKMYQESLYKRFVEDELIFKEVLINAHELKKVRENDFEKDMESARAIEMDFIDAVKQDNF